MKIVMYIAEYWLLSSQKMGLNVLKNCSHIVQTWLLQIKVGKIELSSRLHIREGGADINYIKRFQNAQALSVSVGNSYYEDQIMHIFLDNFHQSGKYSAQLANHKAELKREEKFPDQKCLNISSL